MILWSATAARQLLELEDYLAGYNPQAALAVVERIYAAVHALEGFPGIGRPGRIAGTRELVITGTLYIAMYRLQKDVIQVIALLHGAQLWPGSLPEV